MESNNKSLKKRTNEKENKKHHEEVNDKVTVRPGQLPVKVFENRKSVLTELFENKHMLSMYHIFISLFISISVSSIAHDYFNNGKVRLGYNLVSKGFRNMHLMMMIWFLVFFLSFVPYYGIKYWAKIRSTQKRSWLYFYDRICLLCYTIHLFAMLYVGTKLMVMADMGFAAGLASIMETIRLVMKVYSFGRVCISRAVKEPEKYSKNHPKLSHYMYYSFAPTLLYRDSYPRLSGNIRWSYVAATFFEFITAILFLSMTFDRFYVSEFQNYGLKPLPMKDIIMVTLNNSCYGLLVMLVVNYIVLHLWLNAFAEILRFSDKLFYKDWWTSADYERYYRTWNTVVHDWLYTHVYKDIFENIFPKRKLLGKIAVFFVSSLFHDYAVSLAIGYCIPIFFLFFFIIGELVAFLKFPYNFIGNVFLFYSVGLGSSMMLTIYTLEYYARTNCFKDSSNTIDYFLPKLFECYK